MMALKFSGSVCLLAVLLLFVTPQACGQTTERRNTQEGQNKDNKGEKGPPNNTNKDQGSNEKNSRPALIVIVESPESDSLKGATVMIAIGEYSTHQKTDDFGEAKFSGVPQGNATIRVIAVGFHTKAKVIELKAPQETIKFILDKEP
jgi:hypothetical protein